MLHERHYAPEAIQSRLQEMEELWEELVASCQDKWTKLQDAYKVCQWLQGCQCWILGSFPETAQLPCYMSHLQVCHLIESNWFLKTVAAKHLSVDWLNGIGRIPGDPYGGNGGFGLHSAFCCWFRSRFQRYWGKMCLPIYVNSLHLSQGHLFSSTLRKKPTAAFHSSSSRHMSSHNCELWLLGPSENLCL